MKQRESHVFGTRNGLEQAESWDVHRRNFGGRTDVALVLATGVRSLVRRFSDEKINLERDKSTFDQALTTLLCLTDM